MSQWMLRNITFLQKNYHSLKILNILVDVLQCTINDRPKKFAEGGVCTRERADDVPLSRIQASARGASLERLRG